MPALIQTINSYKAQIPFLALGPPKQEKWLAAHTSALVLVRVCQGIGGALDTISETVKRTSEFWCRMKLEWFYRLISEPKRIQRQNVLPLFVAQALLAKLNVSLNARRDPEMKVLLVAGARPNFIKIAPIYRESLKHNTVECQIVHTAQHYNYLMPQAFFNDLEQSPY